MVDSNLLSMGIVLFNVYVQPFMPDVKTTIAGGFVHGERQLQMLFGACARLVKNLQV